MTERLQLFYPVSLSSLGDPTRGGHRKTHPISTRSQVEIRLNNFFFSQLTNDRHILWVWCLSLLCWPDGLVAGFGRTRCWFRLVVPWSPPQPHICLSACLAAAMASMMMTVAPNMQWYHFVVHFVFDPGIKIQRQLSILTISLFG